MVAAKTLAQPTSKGHQWLALIGAAFVVFEIVFLEFYLNNFWFSVDLTWWGLPAIFCALGAAHLLLSFIESDLGCKALSFLFKGKPAFTYKRWVMLGDGGFSFGLRHVQWSVVDDVELTWFGNLVVRSRAICGADQKKPDILFKFPFSAAAQAEQKLFLEQLKQARPDVVTNQRLTKRVESPIVRGQNVVQAFGGLFMFVMLLDLGYSSFYYLELLKHYYLADAAAMTGDADTAKKELALGDHMFEHPVLRTWISTRFISEKSCAAGLASVKADVLWHLNRHDEALAEARRSMELTPTATRNKLHYVRLLEEAGQKEEARKQIDELIDKHKDWLLPRLYSLANVHDTTPDKLVSRYEESMQELIDQSFSEEPNWPPGGELCVHDQYFSDDIFFVFNRLLGSHFQRKFTPGGDKSADSPAAGKTSGH
jgi:tetratricopeptide (TPR) repeat protein